MRRKQETVEVAHRFSSMPSYREGLGARRHHARYRHGEEIYSVLDPRLRPAA